MAPRRTAVLVSVALLIAGIETSIGNAQETPAPVKAVQLIGLTGVKQNAKGTLKVRFFGGNLKATYDFAKKAAHAAHENFSSPDRK